MVLRNEDYGRISRLLADGENVELEFDIVNRLYPEGRTSYNTIAEIPGTTDEVVMLGGHLDSWHAATGATDNAIGCAVAMEAVRILKAIGVTPRRTIRLALWSGEEQGLARVARLRAPTPRDVRRAESGYDRLSAYVNIDYGTGRVRSMTVFGPAAAAAALRETLAPFKDLGVLGANSMRSRQSATPITRHSAKPGCPASMRCRIPSSTTATRGTRNLDTYERIVEEDVIKSAIVLAATVYHLATRDEMLPRFSNGRDAEATARAQ